MSEFGGERVAQWERRFELPLAVLAVIFLAAYSFDVLDRNLSSTVHRACRLTDYVVWLLFLLEFIGRVSLATDRPRYLWRNVPDLAVIALPVLRPLRVLRLVMLLKVLNRRATDTFRGRVIFYVVGSAIVLVYCAALAVLDAERTHARANITTMGTALWWAVSTVSTVGYGDHYPITTEGRWVAVGLMVGGITLIGAVSASFATWLVDRVRTVEEADRAATTRDLAELHAQLDRLERLLTDDRNGRRTARPAPVTGSAAADPIQPG